MKDETGKESNLGGNVWVEAQCVKI